MLWGAIVLAILATSSCTALNLPITEIDYTQDVDMLNAISEEMANRYADEYMSYMKTGIKSPAFKQMIEQISSTFNGKDLFTKGLADLPLPAMMGVCTVCRGTVNVISRKFREDGGELNGPDAEEKVEEIVLQTCDLFDLQTQEVCTGLVKLNYPFGDYIIHNTVANSRSACSVLPMDICSSKQEEFNYNININNAKPIEAPKAEKPVKGDDDFQIVHLTDIHYDPLYEFDAIAECDEPLCCRTKHTDPVNASILAGYWGDYRNCDSPLRTIEHAFNHIVKTHKDVDIIYHTGDIIPHNIWSTTKEENVQLITKLNDLLAEKFPNAKVYSCAGNHEAHPTNIFSSQDIPDELNINWLYKHLNTVWSKWLPSDTSATILKGGYYTAKVKDGLRVIALNSMDCYLFNWWVYHDGSYTSEQLNWLHDTLLAAEKAGEHVHILSHIPSGDSDCWTVWAREFNRIIERFNPIISGIFGGHTHKDELNVHYSENGHAMAISWNGGSLTTYSNKNPNYVVYDVESKTMQVVDYETWIFDLEKANQKSANGEPEWFKEYTFTNDFGDDLSPAGLDKLLDKMADEPKLLRKYWQYKTTSAQPVKSCSHACLKSTICRLATSVHNQQERCKELKAKLQIALDNEKEEEEDDKDDGGGAASIIALRFSTIIAVYIFIKFLF